MDDDASRCVVVGRVTGVFGVRGWIRVFSYTEPREHILEYSPWLIGADGAWAPAAVLEGRVHGAGIVARLEGCEDRDAARALTGRGIAVERDRLPPTAPGEYYWIDLVGLCARTARGAHLGTVREVLATGANDVLRIEGPYGEQLVPFVREVYVREVDLDAGVIVLDWDPEA